MKNDNVSDYNDDDDSVDTNSESNEDNREDEDDNSEAESDESEDTYNRDRHEDSVKNRGDDSGGLTLYVSCQSLIKLSLINKVCTFVTI